MTIQEALAQNATELQLKIEEHRKLLAMVQEAGINTEELPQCPLYSCPHGKLLRGTLFDTIAVLDETKKSFRSKQLEVLRKKLIEVLAEIA